jgi:hypothetical protein
VQAAATAHTAPADAACMLSEAVVHRTHETGDDGMASTRGLCAVSSGGSRDLISSATQLAARKVKVLAYTALGSFLFDIFKW